MTGTGSINMSQGLEVLQPKASEAYPIPCPEWDSLKERIGRLQSEPWEFGFLGSLMLGASLSTFITIVVGGIGADALGHNVVIAWAVVAVTAAAGVLSVWFAFRERERHRERAGDILTTMTLLEKRYDRNAA